LIGDIFLSRLTLYAAFGVGLFEGAGFALLEQINIGQFLGEGQGISAFVTCRTRRAARLARVQS
jgi:hypothetical protein